MRKTTILALGLLILSMAVSCKKDKKEKARDWNWEDCFIEYAFDFKPGRVECFLLSDETFLEPHYGTDGRGT